MRGLFRSLAAVPLLLLVATSLVVGGCRSATEKTEVEVEVYKVGIDPGSRSPVVVLRATEGEGELPIWIGPTEARAIAMRLEGVESQRPLTHDLAKEMLELAGVGFEKILIHKLEEGTYHARIFLVANGDSVEVDSRPSDAIALALRFESPIFVAAPLLRGTGVAAIHWGGTDALVVHGVTLQSLSAEIAEHFELPAERGVLVSGVSPDAVTGLLPGDVILEADGEIVVGLAGLSEFVRHNPGKIDLLVHRGGARVRASLEPPRR